MEKSDEDGIATSSIIGSDTRIRITETTKSPYAAICYLEAAYGRGRSTDR